MKFEKLTKIIYNLIKEHDKSKEEELYINIFKKITISFLKSRLNEILNNELAKTITYQKELDVSPLISEMKDNMNVSFKSRSNDVRKALFELYEIKEMNPQYPEIDYKIQLDQELQSNFKNLFCIYLTVYNANNSTESSSIEDLYGNYIKSGIIGNEQESNLNIKKIITKTEGHIIKEAIHTILKKLKTLSNLLYQDNSEFKFKVEGNRSNIGYILIRTYSNWRRIRIVKDWDEYWSKHMKSYLAQDMKEMKVELLDLYRNSNSKDNEGSKQNKIEQIGAGWRVNYKNKERIIKHTDGMTYIAMALAKNKKSFPYTALMNVAEIKQTPIQGDFNSIYKSITKLEDRNKQLRENLTQHPIENESEIKENEKEIKKLNNKLYSLKKSHGFKTDKNTKRINDNFNKVFRTAETNIKRNFPEFYKYIKAFLKRQSGKITHIGKIEWKIDLGEKRNNN